MRNWLQRRVMYGQYEKLLAELAAEDAKGFQNYTRISPDLFKELLERVGQRLTPEAFVFADIVRLYVDSPRGMATVY